MSKDNILDKIRFRLLVIGIPRHLINQLALTVDRWLVNSGEEWTVKRLKSLKTFFLHKVANEPCSLPWVRLNAHKLPHGCFGALMRWALHPMNSGRCSRALQALQISTLFISPRLTKSQLDKFLSGVNTDHYFEHDLDSLWFFQKFPRHILGRLDIPRGGNSLFEYRGSPSKKAPGIRSSVTQDSHVLDEYQLFCMKPVRDLASRYSSLFSPVVEGICGTMDGLPDVQSDHLYGGSVHFLQEPGYKLRAIASPYRLFQLALKPLGDSIYRTVSQLPWDCTFDQSKAIPTIQRWLAEGKTIHSIDLTGATDYFPLEIQLYTLTSLFGDVPDISLFEEISRSRWKSVKGDIQWTRGQPLGLYPSFGSFTLTHGILLRYLGGKDNFFLVGDDVVISDDQLASSYTQLLNQWKCPWSPDKSITSNKACEFAGQVILKDKVIPQYKWRKVSDDNFLDLARNIGPRVRTLLTSRQKGVYDAVKHCLPPLGCNHSIPGGNLVSSWCATEKVLSSIGQRRARSRVDLNRHFHNLCYGSDHNYELDLDKIRFMVDALDVKARMVFSNSVFSHWYDLSQVSDIPQALSLSEMLPHEDCVGGYRTTLERYERWLGI